MYNQSSKRQLNHITEIIDLFDHKSSFGFHGSETIFVGGTGGILQGKPLICGGAKYSVMGKNIYDVLPDAYSVLPKHENKKLSKKQKLLQNINGEMLDERAYFASVTLNINQYTTNLWVTGGLGRQKTKSISTSEFVLIRDALDLDDKNEPSEIQQIDSIEGPNLPFTLAYHGMVKVSENAVYIIGGRQNDEISKDVWIVDPTDDYSIIKGPSLKTSRYFFYLLRQ